MFFMSKITKYMVVNSRNFLKRFNFDNNFISPTEATPKRGVGGSKIRRIINCLIVTLLIIISLSVAPASLGDEVNKTYFINLDKITVARGYTINAFSDSIKLSLAPGILGDATGVEITEINEVIETPWQLDKLSRVYQYEIRNKAAYDGKKPIQVEIKYDTTSNYFKQIYFYDKNYNSWRPLPSKDYPSQALVRSQIYLPFARLAVFANPEALVIGKASWYSHKKGNFAASPDFPKGSKLRVYNLDNGKSVDVIVNDFGPDRKLHPDRVVDLEKTVFVKLAPRSQGVIEVRVEPLVILPQLGRILNIASSGAGIILNPTVKSAIVMDEQSGNVWWQKMATTTLPLASLTKLVAIKVFLDTRPSLNQVVAYSLKDEEYNYQYCNKWESAKVKLKDKDTLTIENLLYAALVGSANNAIESLVRVSGLTREEFIKQMNQTVLNWGASSTHFIEPTGLAPQNVSSALDYAIITKEVFTNPIIQKASVMPSYKFTTINTKKVHRFNNTDQLINTSNLIITGSKTGYLNEALYCLMIRAKDASGRQIIAVTFGAPSREVSFAETEELVKYGIYKTKF